MDKLTAHTDLGVSTSAVNLKFPFKRAKRAEIPQQLIVEAEREATIIAKRYGIDPFDLKPCERDLFSICHNVLIAVGRLR